MTDGDAALMRDGEDSEAFDGEAAVLSAEEELEWRQWKLSAALEDPTYDTDHPYYDSSDLCWSD